MRLEKSGAETSGRRLRCAAKLAVCAERIALAMQDDQHVLRNVCDILLRAQVRPGCVGTAGLRLAGTVIEYFGVKRRRNVLFALVRIDRFDRG
jgi:hypothetical protein